MVKEDEKMKEGKTNIFLKDVFKGGSNTPNKMEFNKQLAKLIMELELKRENDETAHFTKKE